MDVDLPSPFVNILISRMEYISHNGSVIITITKVLNSKYQRNQIALSYDIAIVLDFAFYRISLFRYPYVICHHDGIIKSVFLPIPLPAKRRTGFPGNGIAQFTVLAHCRLYNETPMK